MTDLNGKDINCSTFKIQKRTIETGNKEVSVDAVEVRYSCAVTYQDKFFVYGGNSEFVRQILIAANKSLAKVGTLPFDFTMGGCSSTSSKIILCFHIDGDKKTCYISANPKANFKETDKSIHRHRLTKFASAESKFIKQSLCVVRLDEMPVCGGYNNNCEVLDIDKNLWKNIERYPFD